MKKLRHKTPRVESRLFVRLILSVVTELNRAMYYIKDDSSLD